MKSIRFATLCVGLGLSSFSFMDHAQAAPASDNAANYTGTVSWTNGSTAGTGFGLWTFTNNHNGTNTWAGTYLADASNPTNSRNSAIFSTNASGKAFALYANPGGAFMVAKRNFGVSNAVPLAVGETFSFKWLQFWSGGDKGINLFQGGDGDAEKVLNLRQLQDATGNKFVVQPKNFSNSPTAITDAYNDVVTVNLRCAAPDTLVLTVQTGDPADGTYTNTFRAPAPDRVSFYFSNGSNGSNDEPLFNDLAITTNSVATRQVKFSVDMGNFEGATPKRFDPASGDKVYVRGWPVGGWGSEGLVQLFRQTGTTVFTNTVSVPGDVGLSSGGYKFFIEKGSGSSTVVDNNGYEIISEREFILPSGNTNLPIAGFNNLFPSRDVTFAVDMGLQAQLGKFVLGTDKVNLVGDDVTDWATGAEMTRESTNSSIYKITRPVSGTTGSIKQYKFKSLASGAANFGYESELRILTLAAAGTNSQILFTEAFDNQRQVNFAVDMRVQQSKGGFVLGERVYVSGDFNGWGTANELILDNASGLHKATVNLRGAAGQTNAYKFRIQGVTRTNEAMEYEIGDNRSLVFGASPVTNLPTVFFNNDGTAGSTFASWRGTNSPTPELLTQYAFGAVSATNPAGRANLPSGGVSSNQLVLTYYVRADAQNTNLVMPEFHTNLANTNGWTNSGISVTNQGTTNINGVTVEKRQASVPIDTTNSRKFLRLKISE